MTNYTRWINLNESYDDRIAFMSRYIERDSSILDMGAGALALKKYLPPGCLYQPCDIVARDATTIVCDFNKKEYPPLKHYDVVFCSGLLEYIEDLPSFLKQACHYSQRFIISYVAVRGRSRKRIRKREGLDWVNHYSFWQMVKILFTSGFDIINVEDFAGQKIFLLEKLKVNQPKAGWFEIGRVLWIDFINRGKH